MSKWTRFLLLFKRKQYAYDIESRPFMLITYKRLFGTMYILEEKYYE